MFQSVTLLAPENTKKHLSLAFINSFIITVHSLFDVEFIQIEWTHFKSITFNQIKTAKHKHFYKTAKLSDEAQHSNIII